MLRLWAEVIDSMKGIALCLFRFQPCQRLLSLSKEQLSKAVVTKRFSEWSVQDGELKARYLVGLGRDPAIAVLPNIKDDEHLTPALIASLVRVLKVSGFEHCYAEEMKALERWTPSEDEET